MQFLVCGYDGDDAGALDRRLAAREEHLALGDRMAAEGTIPSLPVGRRASGAGILGGRAVVRRL